MAVAVMLEHYLLPERGAVKLKLDRSFEINITAEEARRKVNHWVLTEVSCVMGAMSPTLVVGEEQVVWRVPVELTASHVGHVGIAGMVDVDVQTGTMVVMDENKAEIMQEAKTLAQKMPLYQPRTKADLPNELVATHVQPSILGPQGNPHEIIAAVQRHAAL
jgi:ABC-type iron transport system FetAB permease component